MSMMWVCALTKVCSMSLDNDRLYRVSLDPIKNTVQISCIGMDRVDNSLNDTYLSVDDLPKWVQERIALLMMTDPNPPNSEVEGVGHRVSKYTFWISNKEGWEMNYCIACYDDTEYSWTLANHGYPDGKKFSDVVNPAHHSKLKIHKKVRRAYINHLMSNLKKR